MGHAEISPRFVGGLRSAKLRRIASWAGLGAAALALVAARDFSQNHLLLLNASPSLPNWAFWVERHKRPVHGDYVFFDPPRSPLLVRHFGEKPRLFGKQVMAMPGDIVSHQGNLVLVNGRIVAAIKLLTRRGEPLVAGPVGSVPKGCYFVATNHKDGFDSRYAAIGWVCGPQIVGVGRPIL